MTKTKTIQHEYGEKEIEVVECDSCGQEVAKDESYAFLMTKGRASLAWDDIDANGWACRHCAENPISYPMILGEFWGRVVEYKLEYVLVSIFWFLLGVLFGISIP